MKDSKMRHVGELMLFGIVVYSSVVTGHLGELLLSIGITAVVIAWIFFYH